MALDLASDDQIILASGGYDHTIRLWQTSSGLCQKTLQHSEFQVNALEITPDKKVLASASYQHIYMYDLVSGSATPVVNYEGTSKNVTCVGFQENGRWMYSGTYFLKMICAGFGSDGVVLGGEDGRARIWDLRSKSSQCPKSFDTRHGTGTNLSPINCAVLHPNQVELFMGRFYT